jgi:hypothetical protein
MVSKKMCWTIFRVCEQNVHTKAYQESTDAAEAFIQESPPSLIINVLLVVSRTAPKLMIDWVYQLHPSKGSQSMACTWVVTASNWIVTATTADFYPPPLKIKSVLNKSSTCYLKCGARDQHWETFFSPVRLFTQASWWDRDPCIPLSSWWSQ